MNTLLIIVQAWVLVMALSVDAFVCSFSYGATKIKIPIKSIVIINIICSSLLAVGLLFGNLIGNYIPGNLTMWISFTILLLLGLSKIFDSTIKRIIRKYNGINKDFKFSLFNLGFVLQVYADPEEADIDNSKELSPKEAAPLAIALGIDGLSVGFGVGLAATNAILITGLSFISGVLFVMLGSYLGRKVAQKTDLDLSWLSGAFLIVIAILELF